MQTNKLFVIGECGLGKHEIGEHEIGENGIGELGIVSSGQATLNKVNGACDKANIDLINLIVYQKRGENHLSSALRLND